jgi:hypothetical protein
MLILSMAMACYARASDTTAIPPGPNIDPRALQKLNSSYADMNQSLGNNSLQFVNQLQKQEAKLKAQLARKDSSRAAQLFAGSEDVYARLRAKLQTGQNLGLPVSSLTSYISKLDSIGTALRWMPAATSLSAGNLQKAQAVAGEVGQLQGKLQAAGEIQQYAQQRAQQLKDQLASYGMGKTLLGMSKAVYYYQQRVAQYKSLLNDKQKWQDAALTAIRQLPAIQSIMLKHSWLSQLFPAPAGAGTVAGLAGSQTASSVAAELKQRLGGLSTDPIAYMQQQVGGSQGQIDQAQSKLSSVGSVAGASEVTVPDFTPNSQKTKTFFRRLELGFNIQSAKSSILLPTTSSLALTAGYKLSDKATVGVGAAYNIGWGNSLSHIQVSSQGVSLRSFLDVKVKGGFWITGGFEYNYYNSFTQFSDLITNSSTWEKAALLGVTKKYKIGSRSGNLQLLYDLLSKDHIPQTQPLIFRVGYQL